MRAGVGVALALVLPAFVAAGPAAASTIPPLDLQAGQTAVGFGVARPGLDLDVDFSFDRALGERQSLGLTVHHRMSDFRAPKTMLAARLAWMPVDYAGVLWSAGGGHSPWGDDVLEGFAQVAGALKFGWGPASLRLTLGPALTFMARTAPRQGGITWFDPTPSEGNGNLSVIPLVPNAELGVRVWAGHEIVLGGYTILGWRGRF